MPKDNQINEHSKRSYQAPLGPRIFAFASMAISLSGCSTDLFWRDSYNLRRWEFAYLAGQTAMREHNYATAQNDFRTALGYADLLHNSADSGKQVTTTYALAQACNLDGNLPEAERWYQKSLSVSNELIKAGGVAEQQKILKEQNAEILGQLGELHYKQKRLELARSELANSLQAFRALGILDGSSESSLGSKLDYARELANAAAVAYDCADYAEAERLCKELQNPTLIASCPPTIADAAQTVYINTLRKEGKTEEAASLGLTDDWKKACADARFSEIQKDSDKALEQYLRALAIAGKIKENAEVLDRTQTALASLYLDRADRANARKYAMLAARGGRSSLELDRVLVVLARRDLFEPFSVVEPEAQTLLRLRQKLFGDKDSKVGIAYVILAAISEYNRMPAKFESYCDAAFSRLNGGTIAMRSDKREFDSSCLWLADFLFCQGKYAEAKTMYEQLLHAGDAQRSAVTVSRLLRDAAANSALHSDQESHDQEQHAKQLLNNNPNFGFAALRSLTPFASDLQAHKRYSDAKKICGYLKDILPEAKPYSDKDQDYAKVCKQTIEAIEHSRVAPVKRLLGRIVPGSVEDTEERDPRVE